MAERALPSGLRRLADVAGAAAAALLAFTAVPAVLLFVVGNPVHGGIGRTWSAWPHGALVVLTAVAWLAWALCCVQLLRSVSVSVRRGQVAPVHGGSMLDRVAGRIAVGVLAMTSVGAPVGLATGAGATGTPQHAVVHA